MVELRSTRRMSMLVALVLVVLLLLTACAARDRLTGSTAIIGPIPEVENTTPSSPATAGKDSYKSNLITGTT